jgi:FixJ family two-component response regulator
LATIHVPQTDTPPVEEEPIVLIVEDDALVRAGMESLFHSAGLRSRSYASAREVLDAKLPDAVCCFVLDVRLPQISGLDLQTELARRGADIPIVFVTGHGDIPMSVQAMKAGAVDFLPKPFRDQDMIDAVVGALQRDAQRLEANSSLIETRERWYALTPREREVLTNVAAGLMNKQIAARMCIAEVTVKIHRGQAMRKMNVRTVADLVRNIVALGIETGTK